MIKECQLRVTPQTAAEGDRLRLYVAKQEGIDVRTITEVRVLRKSIDARQRNIAVNLKLRVYIGEGPQEPASNPADDPCVARTSGRVSVTSPQFRACKR